MKREPQADDLPDPLVPSAVDLKNFPFTPMYRSRLFGSSFHARANDAEWRAGVTLWLKSQDQVPAGSLPNDDIDLCRLAELGRDVKAWRKVKDMALHGWALCSDGRLYHPIMAEIDNEQIVCKFVRRRNHEFRHLLINKIQNRRLPCNQWSNIRKRIFTRDGVICALCRDTDGPFEIDHIFPLIEGGDNSEMNLQVLCRACNRRKARKVPGGSPVYA